MVADFKASAKSWAELLPLICSHTRINIVFRNPLMHLQKNPENKRGRNTK